MGRRVEILLNAVGNTLDGGEAVSFDYNRIQFILMELPTVNAAFKASGFKGISSKF